MKTYFDLKKLRSYMVKTQHNKYHFVKGTPLPVENQEDIDRFKSEYEILTEVTKTGEPIFQEVLERKNGRSFAQFRASNLPGDMDHETLLKKAFEEAERSRATKPVDVKNLLAEVGKDLVTHGLKHTDDDAKFGVVVDEAIENQGFDVDAKEIKKNAEPKAVEEIAEETDESRALAKEIEAEKVKDAKKVKKLKKNQCEKCERQFDSKKDLDKHLEEHEDEE